MRGNANFAGRLQCVLLLLVVARTAAAVSIIYVDADAPGANNGSSWENAYVFLQDALAEAETAEKPLEIRVAQGIYTPDSNSASPDGTGSRKATFQLINDVTIMGGYAGFGESNPNAHNIEAYETILSGDLNGDDIDVNDPFDLHDTPNRYENSESVVTGNNIDANAILDGFTISGGRWYEGVSGMIDFRRSGPRVYKGGAGMNNFSGSPTVVKCTFTRNISNTRGAGMHNSEGSNPTVIDCTFTLNYTEGSGAAMVNLKDCNPKVIDCTFSNNFVRHDGGAMVNFNNSPTLTNCAFSYNSTLRPLGGSRAKAGAMYNRNSSPMLIECTFSENASEEGGAIYNDEGTNPTLIGCTFINNLADRYGGAISTHYIDSSLVLTECVFKQNFAPQGGALKVYCHTFLTECTFAGNSAVWDGGAVSIASAVFDNCLFAGNRAIGDDSSSGGAVHVIGGAPFETAIIFNNCTFSNNWADSGCGIYCEGIAYINNCIFWEPKDQIFTHEHSIVMMFADYSNIHGGWTWLGKGNIDTDPCFANPGYWSDADDPNIVVEPNDPNAVWIDGDYHLKSEAGRWNPANQSWIQDDVTSPCIDTGAPNMPVGAEPEPNGGIINMGAYGGTSQASMSPSGLHAIYGGGTGTSSHPYLIYTAEQLNTIGTESNDWDKHFKLMADIDLSAYSGTDFNIIGQSYENPFNGYIDGNGHTISRFTFADSHGRGIGLVSYLGTSGCVKNLIMTDTDIEGRTYVGSLVGYNRGIVQNCRVVRGKVQAYDQTGGIVGHSTGPGLITECHADVNLSGDHYTGGIAGANGSTISFCSAIGSVAGHYNTGGITGGHGSNSVIHDCQSACFVSGTYRATGGLVGYNHSGTVSRCYSTGNVVGTGRADGVGGLVGENSFYYSSNAKGMINQCFSSGDVSGFLNVGGLVGMNCGTIINCYATGSVNGEYSVGGLVGRNSYSYGQEVFPGYIYKCYSIGSISGDVHGGGLIGYSYAGEIGNSFWDVETSSWLTSDGGTGKSTVEMQMARTFLNAGWDLVDETTNGTEDIWLILEGQDYPRLYWEPTEKYLLDN